MGLTRAQAKKRKQIRDDLIVQLEIRRVPVAHFIDLVDDYMGMYDAKNMLHDDIQKRGVNVPCVRNGLKKNDSLRQLLDINAQMLRILAHLEIKPSKIVSEDDIDGNDDL